MNNIYLISHCGRMWERPIPEISPEPVCKQLLNKATSGFEDMAACETRSCSQNLYLQAALSTEYIIAVGEFTDSANSFPASRVWSFVQNPVIQSIAYTYRRIA